MRSDVAAFAPNGKQQPCLEQGRCCTAVQGFGAAAVWLLLLPLLWLRMPETVTVCLSSHLTLILPLPVLLLLLLL